MVLWCCAGFEKLKISTSKLKKPEKKEIFFLQQQITEGQKVLFNMIYCTVHLITAQRQQLDRSLAPLDLIS